MKVKRIRKKCMMRGCKNIDSYAISKSFEFGGVNLCKDCLQSALNMIKVQENPKKKELQEGKNNGENKNMDTSLKDITSDKKNGKTKKNESQK